MEALNNLGIDWKSILLYVVNFGIILLILSKYLYKPVLKVLDKRRTIIEGAIKEAEELKKELQKREKEIENEKKKAEKMLKDKMEKLRKYAEKKRSELVKGMDIQRAQMIEQTNAEIEEKKGSIMKIAEKETIELIKKIVLSIIQHKIPEEVIQKSIQEAWEKEEAMK